MVAVQGGPCSVREELYPGFNCLIITCTDYLLQGSLFDSFGRVQTEYEHSKLTVTVGFWLSHTHSDTLWMWNMITHATGPMSVSYESAMKPLVDKSPPTGAQEFGSLMKKSCWAGRSWSAWLWGLERHPIEAPTEGELWSAVRVSGVDSIPLNCLEFGAVI